MDLSAAVTRSRHAGMVTVHHARTVHGAALNRSQRPRRLFLLQYAAVDAWPILGIKDWDKFNAAIVRGEPTFDPLMVEAPIRITLPMSQIKGSLYEQQRIMANLHLEVYETPPHKDSVAA